MSKGDIAFAIWLFPFGVVALFFIWAFFFLMIPSEFKRWRARRQSPYRAERRPLKERLRGHVNAETITAAVILVWIIGGYLVVVYLNSKG